MLWTIFDNQLIIVFKHICAWLLFRYLYLYTYIYIALTTLKMFKLINIFTHYWNERCMNETQISKNFVY